MEQKKRTYKFAGRESSPKSKYGISKIRVFDEATWYQNHYGTSRAIGNAKYKVDQMYRQGCGNRSSGHAWYDVRLIPVGVIKQLRDIDDFIEELQAERQNILNEHFTEWDTATEDDCSTVHPANPMTKAEAQAKCKELNKTLKISPEQAQSEKRMISQINQAISGTLLKNM